MSDLAAAYRARNICQTWLQCTGDLLDSLTSPDPSASVTINDLQSARAQVQFRLDQWDLTAATIERLVDDQELSTVINESFRYRQTIIDRLNRADNSIALIYNVTAPKAESDVGSVSNVHNPSLFKLPKISIPPFHGELVKWVTFWEIFNSMVHDVCSYTDLHKMIYLVNSLKGDAANIVKGLAVSGSNYQVARRALEERYGRKDLIIQSHVQSLLDDLKVTCSESSGSKYVRSLWSFYDQVMTHIRSLETLGISGEKVEVFLNVIILRNLPVTVRQKWCEITLEKDRKSDLDSLCQFIYKTITNLDAAESFRNKDNNNNTKSKSSSSKPSTSALQISSSNVNKKGSSKKCNHCDKPGHILANCYSFTSLDIDKRIDRLKQLKLCTKCLTPNHEFLLVPLNAHIVH